MVKNLRIFGEKLRFRLLRASVRLAKREGDPVIEQPFLLEVQHHQEEVFVDVFQVLAQPDGLGVQRFRHERLELFRGLHLASTSYLPLL